MSESLAWNQSQYLSHCRSDAAWKMANSHWQVAGSTASATGDSEPRSATAGCQCQWPGVSTSDRALYQIAAHVAAQSKHRRWPRVGASVGLARGRCFIAARRCAFKFGGGAGLETLARVQLGLVSWALPKLRLSCLSGLFNADAASWLASVRG
jgi:hypothetical protein